MKSAQLNRPFRVLMIEDNPDDIDLTREAFQETKILIDLQVARDGAEGLEFLYQQGQYTNSLLPDLILLDLNLPKVGGHEVLARIKSDECLKHIPVVILTTSETEEDILRAYQHHVNSYIIKPVDFDQFVQVVKSIDNFWLTVVNLPQREPRYEKRNH